MNNRSKCLLSLALAAVSLAPSCVGGRQYYADPASELPFSKAVRVGNTVYVSGHLGRDAETGQAPADPKEEIRLMLDAFSESLALAGLSMDNLVQVQVHCTDLSLYSTFNDLYKQRFEKNFPTRAFIGAGTLLRGCRFEILGIAAD